LSPGLPKLCTSGGHDDASSAYLIYFASTGRTRVVGTPNFIEDVNAYTSRLIDSTSVAVLPVDPTELFYDKPAPLFHDTVNPKTNFDVVGLGAWYSHEDHELIIKHAYVGIPLIVLHI
jgi:hypothetical protein